MSTVPYEVSIRTADFGAAALRRAWSALVESRGTVDAALQSPEYVECLRQSETDAQFEVLPVCDAASTTMVGVVPIKLWKYSFDFAVGTRVLFRIGISTLGILGREPLIPDDPQAFDALFVSIAKQYPKIRAIYLHAVCSSGSLWQQFQRSPAIRALYQPLILGGFREWHVVPVPASAQVYRERFTKKQRYNLGRQERLLRDHLAADLSLVRICSEEAVAALADGVQRMPFRHKLHFVFDPQRYRDLARHGFLNAYVLRGGEQVVGFLLGMTAGRTLRVLALYHNSSLSKFSPGTTFWHLVIQDLIARAEITDVEFGYGEPAYKHRDVHQIDTRATVLLLRRSLGNRCLLLGHSLYTSLKAASAGLGALLRRIAR